MSSENISPAADNAAATVAAVVDGAIDAAAASVDTANARAEAAEEVAALLTEAAIQRTITDDVNDLREELEQCQNDLQSAQALIASLETRVTETQASLTLFLTMEQLMAEMAKYQPLPPPSIRPQPNPETIPPTNPSEAGEGQGGVEIPKAPDQKSNRYRLT